MLLKGILSSVDLSVTTKTTRDRERMILITELLKSLHLCDPELTPHFQPHYTSGPLKNVQNVEVPHL